MSDTKVLIRDGFEVEFSKDAPVSLTKLWKMAGSPNSQTPARWKRLPETKKLVNQISKEYKVGKSHLLQSKAGKGGETLGHYKLALEYAGYLSVEFKSWMLEVIGELIESPEEFAADILINSHNKERVERAKKRVLVSGTNKETMELAKLDGTNYADIHNDRYRGLYRKNASQLRKDAGLKPSETPLDKLSAYDLNLNSIANQMALMSGSPSKILDAANGLRELHEKTVGKPLEPTWEENYLRPNQAKAIAFKPEYQGELPLSV